MRTLNVFKLARNVDYNLGSSGGVAGGGELDDGPCCASSKKYSIPHNNNKSSFKKKPDYSSARQQPTYTPVDPDSVMGSPEKKQQQQQEQQLKSPVSTPVSSSADVGSVSLDVGTATPEERNAQLPEVIIIRKNGVEKEPELYKRIVTLAPFTCTSREPSLEEDEPDGGGGGGWESRKSSKSVSKTESSISISTLELNWVDPKLIKEGRNFVRRNFLGVMFAHFIGLAFLLAVRPVAALLLRNGRFHTKAKRNNWHQYLLLYRRLKSWYESGNLQELTDPTTGDILQLRKSFCSAGKSFRKFVPPPAQELSLDENEYKLLSAVKEDLQGLKHRDSTLEDVKNIPKIFGTVNPDVPWSQYDLAIVQFMFFGLISLFPSKFGIHNLKGMKGFLHLWAVIGHLLGLERRYNLCLAENWDEATNRKIFENVVLFSFKIGDNGWIKMLHLMCESCTWFTIFLTRMKLVLIFMTREVAQVSSTKNLFLLVKAHDKVEYFLYTFWNRYLVRLFFMRILVNFLARTVLLMAYGLYLGQIKWKQWRAKRKPPQQVVIFPSSISLELSKTQA